MINRCQKILLVHEHSGCGVRKYYMICKNTVAVLMYLIYHVIFLDNLRVRIMMFNATFTNISVISWRSVILLEETGVLWENHRPATSHWQTLSHNVVSYTLVRLELTTLVVIGTHCIGRYKSNYHTITTTTAPWIIWSGYHKI